MSQTKLGTNDFVPTLARSSDSGKTWTGERAIWPALRDGWSIFASISAARSTSELYMFGTRTRIDNRGEPVWSDATKGLKANELIWARAADDRGQSWSPPRVVPMPIPGAAEAPSPMLVTRSGRWLATYAPYNTFDPAVKVDRGQIVVMMSDNRGERWRHASMLRFEDADSGGAEAWVCELADGRLLGAAWHVDLSAGPTAREHPNKYAMSADGGQTWTPTRSTGTLGHTTALTALPDGRVLFTTVRRRKDAPSGIWITIARPTPDDFGVEAEQCVWSIDRATQSGADVSHDAWTNYSFGEPALMLLPDGTLLLVFWYADAAHCGVQWMKLRISGK